MKGFLEKIASVLLVVLSFLSIRHLLGFDSYDTYKDAVEDIAMGELYELLPFSLPDFKLLFLALIAVVIYFLVIRKSLKRHILAKLGVGITVLCLFLSFTPVGTYAPLLGAVFNEMDMYDEQGVWGIPKEGGGYTITDKKVVCVNDPENPTITIYGTLNNMTNYDWGGGMVIFWCLMDDGSTGNVGMQFEYNIPQIVPSGSSISFELQNPFFTRLNEGRDFTDYKVWKIEVIPIEK